MSSETSNERSRTDAAAGDARATSERHPAAEVPVRLLNVWHEYTDGQPVLRGISLSVREGDRVGIVGASGAGKSTLLRTINGLVTPTRGEVWVLGQRMDSLPEPARRILRRQIGMVFQEFALVERLTVLTNVLIGRLGYVPTTQSLLRIFPEADIRMALEALDEVGLAELRDRQVRHLSGGQKQRVGIARAIVQGARIILADEPTANLDVRTADTVLKLLLESAERHGTTVLLNLHDVRAARRYCDRVVGMRGGRVVWEGSAADFQSEQVELVFYSDDGSGGAETRGK